MQLESSKHKNWPTDSNWGYNFTAETGGGTPRTRCHNQILSSFKLTRLCEFHNSAHLHLEQQLMAQPESTGTPSQISPLCMADCWTGHWTEALASTEPEVAHKQHASSSSEDPGAASTQAAAWQCRKCSVCHTPAGAGNAGEIAALTSQGPYPTLTQPVMQLWETCTSLIYLEALLSLVSPGCEACRFLQHEKNLCHVL